MKTDTFRDIAEAQMGLIVKMSECLVEADRLLRLEAGGTEKWCRELEAWRRRVRKLKDCQND